jgi:hypothetical protein
MPPLLCGWCLFVKSETRFFGFLVRKEDISRSQVQLRKISLLSNVQKQFIATLTDTEAAIGYFRARVGTPDWTCYLAVKMKNRGVVSHLSSLIGLAEPSKSRTWNTLKHSHDLRWSKQVMGIVAYSLLREIRPLLYNEKTILEANCILSKGPIVRGGPHPFELWGARRVRRGVWYWPQLEETLPETNALVHSD